MALTISMTNPTKTTKAAKKQDTTFPNHAAYVENIGAAVANTKLELLRRHALYQTLVAQVDAKLDALEKDSYLPASLSLNLGLKHAVPQDTLKDLLPQLNTHCQPRGVVLTGVDNPQYKNTNLLWLSPNVYGLPEPDTIGHRWFADWTSRANSRMQGAAMDFLRDLPHHLARAAKNNDNLGKTHITVSTTLSLGGMGAHTDAILHHAMNHLPMTAKIYKLLGEVDGLTYRMYPKSDGFQIDVTVPILG